MSDFNDIFIEEDEYCLRVSKVNDYESVSSDDSHYGPPERFFIFTLVGASADFDRYECSGWTIHLPHWYSRIGGEVSKKITMYLDCDRGSVFTLKNKELNGYVLYSSHDLDLLIPSHVCEEFGTKAELMIDFE